MKRKTALQPSFSIHDSGGWFSEIAFVKLLNCWYFYFIINLFIACIHPAQPGIFLKKKKIEIPFFYALIMPIFLLINP